MTATLRLTPLSPEECDARLGRKGETVNHSPGVPLVDASQYSAVAECARSRAPITLKLCLSKEDVVEVDARVAAQGVVRHATVYRDGSTAALASLGRNLTTGIKWTMVSRALCDVSLTRAGRRDAGVVDLAASPPEGGTAPGRSPSTSGESQSEDDGARGAAGGRPEEGAGVNSQTSLHPAVAFLSLRKPVGAHSVHLNGVPVAAPLGRDVPLSHGAIVALWGPTGLAYEVAIAQEGAHDDAHADIESSPKKRKANPPSESQDQSRRDLRRRAHELEVGELTCAMCLEVLVRATCAYPCMHAFCAECARGVADALDAPGRARTRTHKGTCITCRGKVEGWGAARSFDTIVWATALQGKFARDDAEHYLERRVQCGMQPPTDVERDSILNRGTGDDDGAQVQGSENLYLPPSPSRQPPAASYIRTLPPLFAAPERAGGLYVGSDGSTAASLLPASIPKPSSNDVICID